MQNPLQRVVNNPPVHVEAAEMSRVNCSRAAPPAAEPSASTPPDACCPICPVLMGVAIATAALLSAGLRREAVAAAAAGRRLYGPVAGCPADEAGPPAEFAEGGVAE